MCRINESNLVQKYSVFLRNCGFRVGAFYFAAPCTVHHTTSVLCSCVCVYVSRTDWILCDTVRVVNRREPMVSRYKCPEYLRMREADWRRAPQCQRATDLRRVPCHRLLRKWFQNYTKHCRLTQRSP